jgi:hypothetical protein
MSSPEVQFFVDEYRRSLKAAREKHYFSQLYDTLFVIPFHIDPLDLEGDFIGALWVPPMQLQDQIAPVQHWRGYAEFQGFVSRFESAFGTEHYIGASTFRGYLELVSVEPEQVDLKVHDSPFVSESMTQQVEQDFGVIVTSTI